MDKEREENLDFVNMKLNFIHPKGLLNLTSSKKFISKFYLFSLIQIQIQNTKFKFKTVEVESQTFTFYTNFLTFVCFCV